MCGFNRSPEAIDAALASGAIDQAAASVEEAVDGADVCFVCTSVATLPEFVGRALSVGGDCVVSDVGSTKARLREELRASGLAEGTLNRFVGGHPLAGAEASGVDHARKELFEGAVWYLTPGESTSGVLYDRLYRVVSDLGARPIALDAATHDRLVATVSHLPQVLANALVVQAAQALVEESQSLPATGPSFRDATRVAGANPPMWRDIFLANRDAIEHELSDFIARLEGARDVLRAGNADAIEGWIEDSRADRERLLDRELAGGTVSELRVTVPNRPGVLAQVSLALGEAGVNIVDMALYPAPDMESGAITIWVAGEQASERAVGLIAELGYPAAVVDRDKGE